MRVVPLPALGFALMVVATLGCGDDPADVGPDHPVGSGALDSSVGHLGRIHVILHPSPDELEPEPQLQISARFVEYRNVAEAFVRARAKLPVPVWEQLEPGQCVASSTLLPPAPPAPAVEPELSLIDAGDLRVTLGTRDVVVPLALVPDILPWLSGVEYLHVDDRIPQLAVEPDGTSPLSISIDGTPELGLDPFEVSTRLPAALVLEAAAIRADAGELWIDWQPPGDETETILLQLQAFSSSEGIAEPSGEELTCLVPDTGRATLGLDGLAQAGLATGASLLRVAASRFDSRTIDTGAFEGVEVIVEMRDQRTLSLVAPAG